MRGRYLLFCSSVPNLMITGATMLTPKGMVRGAPAAALSSSKMCFSTGPQSVPPCSTGQPGAYQPLRDRICCQRWWSSLVRCLPSFTLLAMSAGSSCLRNSRTSSRKAICSADEWISMLGPRCCSAHGCPPGAPVDKSEISELASFFGQFLEQRCRLPPGAQLLVEFADAGVDTIQTDRVSIEHRPALMGREAVAVDIDDVDIAGTLGNALFQDLGAFVDQRVHGALDDVFIG